MGPQSRCLGGDCGSSVPVVSVTVSPDPVPFDVESESLAALDAAGRSHGFMAWPPPPPPPPREVSWSAGKLSSMKHPNQ